MVAFTQQGLRLELLLIGFCVAERDANYGHHIAIEIVEFACSQLENTEWELSQFFDRESSGSKLLLMSALLSSYCGAVGTERC